ncbi:hypothetical protein NAB22_18665 [Proteus mirabilis]|nr:hypothetical protein [Proteus mirabilis]
MKTANVKWGRGKREATGKKVNARDEFVRPTWIDLSFPGNGARNTSATATKDLPTAPEIGVLLDTPQQRHQESFSCGYALRDFLGKYAKDFPRGLGALRWCSLEAERVM